MKRDVLMIFFPSDVDVLLLNIPHAHNIRNISTKLNEYCATNRSFRSAVFPLGYDYTGRRQTQTLHIKYVPHKIQ